MSSQARFVSILLKTTGKPTEKQTERRIAFLKKRSEIKTIAPLRVNARMVEKRNGRLFYMNEKSKSEYLLFYVHGGGFLYDFNTFHWSLIKKISKKIDAVAIAPAYKLIPYGSWKEAFALMVDAYTKCLAKYPDRKIIMMGDSAGGGLALSLILEFKRLGLHLPDRTILLSPWVDISMDNPELISSSKKDPWLSFPWLKACGKHWAGELDVHDDRVSPIYGDLSDLNNVTMFVGTREIFLPDVKKAFHLLPKNKTNNLIIGRGLNHVYPLMPIPEGRAAVKEIIKIIKQ